MSIVDEHLERERRRDRGRERKVKRERQRERERKFERVRVGGVQKVEEPLDLPYAYQIQEIRYFNAIVGMGCKYVPRGGK